MTLKSDAKFGEALTCCFKINMEKLTNFDPSPQKSKGFHFNAFIFGKVYIVWDKKRDVQRCYLSTHWRMIKNLDRDWFVVSKLTWGIWQTLTRAFVSLKDVHLNGLLLSKVYIFWAKKVQRRYLLWHWRVRQNLQLELWWDTFIQCWKYMSLKFSEQLCVMPMKNDAKFRK